MKRLKWTYLALIPFILCVLFLRGLGKICGLTYKQISVIFNLWIQGAVLMISGLFLWGTIIYRYINSNDISWIYATILYFPIAYLYVYGFIKMLCHYHLPFDRAFDRCVIDLKMLALKWHTTYQVVNLIIFVFIFLLILSLNIVIGYYILNII